MAYHGAFVVAAAGPIERVRNLERLARRLGEETVRRVLGTGVGQLRHAAPSIGGKCKWRTRIRRIMLEQQWHRLQSAQQPKYYKIIVKTSRGLSARIIVNNALSMLKRGSRASRASVVSWRSKWLRPA